MLTAEWKLPLPIAKQLWEASMDDECRACLYHTVNVVEDPADPEYLLLVSTDTHRLYVTRIFKDTYGVAPGLWRWKVRPTAKLQLVEAETCNAFPNWRRVIPDPEKCAGFGYFDADKGYLEVTGICPFDTNKLPQIGKWDIYLCTKNPRWPGPIAFVGEDQFYLLMPLAKEAIPAPRFGEQFKKWSAAWRPAEEPVETVSAEPAEEKEPVAA